MSHSPDRYPDPAHPDATVSRGSEENGGRLTARRVRQLLLLVLAISLLVRLGMGLLLFPPDFGEQERWYWHHTSDYMEIARNLANGEGYSFDGAPTGILTPGVPVLLAGHLHLFGEKVEPLVLALSLLGVLTTWATFRVGRVVFGARAGLVAAALHAGNPYLARLEVSAAEAAPYALSLALLMLAVLRAGRLGRHRDYLLAGGVLGITFLIRPTVGAFAPLAALWLLLVSRRRIHALLGIGLMAAVCLLVVMPWVVRNHRVFDRLVLTRTNGGQNLWFGHNEHLEKVYPEYTLDSLKPVARQMWYESGRPRRGGVGGYLDRQDYYGELAKAHIREDPGRFVRRFFSKVTELYSWRLSPVYETFPGVRLVEGELQISAKEEPRPILERLGYGIPHAVVLLLGVIGLLAARGRMRNIRPLLLLLLANTLVYGLYFGTTKNRAPTDIFLMVLAGWGASVVIGKLGRFRRKVC